MEERWMPIPGFEDYEVSDHGHIQNVKHRRGVVPSTNQFGIMRVGLSKANRVYTRALAGLVAEAFVPRPHEKFDTPIHLNGDRRDCRAENLAWRPRWFAIKYHKQFGSPRFELSDISVTEDLTGQYYHTVRDACVANGILWADVVRSFVSGRPTFPTGQMFKR